MISKDTFSEVRDLLHSIQVWHRLESCFNMASLTRALDLKHFFTNISLERNQSMDSYSHSVKTIADALAAIQSPISDLELIQLTTAGLPDDYDSFVTTYSMLLGLLRLMTYDLNCSFLNNALNTKRIVVNLFIKLLLLLPVIVKGKGWFWSSE